MTASHAVKVEPAPVMVSLSLITACRFVPDIWYAPGQDRGRQNHDEVIERQPEDV